MPIETIIWLLAFANKRNIIMRKYESVEDMVNERLWSAGKGMSAFDNGSNYMGDDRSEWVIAISQTRDSDCLERSNYEAMLEALGGDKEGKVQIFGVNHWACGWVDQIQVHKDAEKELKILLECLNALAIYPVLDDIKHSEMEMEEANETWANCYNAKERIAYIRKNRSQFEFRSFGDMLECVRGKYFAGYASELLY
jgi:hypothetical protein